jgi:hypothetical protein
MFLWKKNKTNSVSLLIILYFSLFHWYGPVSVQMVNTLSGGEVRTWREDPPPSPQGIKQIPQDHKQAFRPFLNPLPLLIILVAIQSHSLIWLTSSDIYSLDPRLGMQAPRNVLKKWKSQQERVRVRCESSGWTNHTYFHSAVWNSPSGLIHTHFLLS